MRPVPVTPRSRAKLRDRDAAPPPGLPSHLKTATEKLLQRLNELQDALYAEANRSLLVVIQGRDAAGKDATIKAVCSAFNPQGCSVSAFKEPTITELAHDYLWRVHQVTPARRMIGVFNRSHYEDVLTARVHRLVPRSVWQQRYRQINDFERMLTENGTAIIKVMLHVSRKEQRKRLLARLTDAKKNWKFSESDVSERARWGEFTAAYRDAISRCSPPWAPWYVVPADDKHARNYLVAKILTTTLERLHPRYPTADRRLLRRLARLI